MRRARVGWGRAARGRRSGPGRRGGPARRGGLDGDEDASVGPELLDAVLGERGAEEVAGERLEAGTIVWGDPDVGVEIEAIELGLTRAAGGDVTEGRPVAEAAEAGTSAGAEGDAALDGGVGEAGQDGGGVGERVRRGGVVSGLEVAAGEQPPHAGTDGGEDVRDVLVAREGGRGKGEVPGSSLAEDTVEHERVEVDVQPAYFLALWVPIYPCLYFPKPL